MRVSFNFQKRGIRAPYPSSGELCGLLACADGAMQKRKRVACPFIDVGSRGKRRSNRQARCEFALVLAETLGLTCRSDRTTPRAESPRTPESPAAPPPRLTRSSPWSCSTAHTVLAVNGADVDGTTVPGELYRGNAVCPRLCCWHWRRHWA